MSFVVDASVALAWILPDERSASSDHLLTHLADRAIVAPAHWLSETANGLLMAERRKRVTAAVCVKALEWLSTLDVVIDGGGFPPLGAAMPLARAHQLSVYDALYLELAARKGLELATFDKQLIAAAAQTGVKTIP